ncbi:glycosyltransferase family 2 protein [Lactiplantibacillus plantarum]|uniref:glycosyltransferase family 2 protein n=2 Tax=Lactiplantibacillus plantarum TaxID=1590 RepID=UPI000FF8F51D|nr:glycosyltransferase family 2 protein [Lactiplantibacillus plantarum]
MSDKPAMKQKHSILLSIIIPVYNVEDYLQECLDSILLKSGLTNNVEVLLINDGSNDNSKAICEKYATEYGIIHTYTKKNGGLSDARNYGLHLATGKYIFFIDSDDCVVSHGMQVLLQFLKENDVDLLHIKYRSFFNNKDVYGKNSNLQVLHAGHMTSESMLTEILKRDVENYAWSFIVKKTVFKENSILFPVGRNYEDMATTYKIIHFSQKIVSLDQIIYLYRNRKGSIANTATLENVQDILVNLHEMDAFLRVHSSFVYQTFFANFAISFLLFAFYESYKAGADKDYKYKIKENLKKYYHMYKKSPVNFLNKKFRLGYFLVNCGLFIPLQNIRVNIRRFGQRTDL